jgi:hypothetical protein
MPDRFVESHIRQLPIFAKIPPQHLKWVVEAIRMLRVQPGEVIFEQGQSAEGMYMFISGRGQLVQADEHGNERIIGHVGPNQYLNELALFKNLTESATLQVMEPGMLLFISRRRLANILTHHPEIKPYLPIPEAARRRSAQEQVFQGQRANETVILDTRRHWWALARKAWFPLVIGTLILGLASLVPSSGVALALGSLGLILPGIIMVLFYLEWRNDHLIITDHRIVRIQHIIHLFKTNISETPLVSVQEVFADMYTADPFSRVFHYGTLRIRTAGNAGNMKLTVMPRPDRIQQLIFENRQRYNENLQRTHRSTIRAELDKVFDEEGNYQGPATAEPTTPPKREPEGRSWWQVTFTNEEGKTVYRKHHIVLIRTAIWPALWIIGSAALFVLSLSSIALTGLGALGPVFAFFLFLVGCLWLYWADWDWRNDYYIIGDETIRLIHRRPLWLQNETDQVLVNSVDNVVSERSGLLPTLLDYGNVRISLIGADVEGGKHLKNVPRPQEVQAEITRRQARLRRRVQEEEERRMREQISEYLTVYHERQNSQSGDPQTQAPPSQQQTEWHSPTQPGAQTDPQQTQWQPPTQPGPQAQPPRQPHPQQPPGPSGPQGPEPRQQDPRRPRQPQPPPGQGSIGDRMRPPGVPRIRRDE